MAISPGGVFAQRSSGIVKEGMLSQQNKWLRRMLAASHRPFGSCDFIQRAAQVNRSSTPTLLSFPRNWPVQGVVDFKDARTIPVNLETAAVGSRQATSHQGQHLLARNVQKHPPRLCQLL